MDRRRFLSRVTALGGIAASAGCLRFADDGTETANDEQPESGGGDTGGDGDGSDGNDGSDGGSDRASLETLRSWAPDPARVGPQTHAPLTAVVPSALAPHEGDFDEAVYRLFTDVIERYDAVTQPFRRFDGLLDGPHYTVALGSFTPEEVVDPAEAGLESRGTRGPFQLYAGGDSEDGGVDQALAVDDGRLVLGTAAPDTDAETVVERVIDAGDGTGRYVDAAAGARRVTDAFSESAYAVVVPVGGPPKTNPDANVFESEAGYGLGLTVGDEAQRTVVRTFEGDAPVEATSDLDGSVTRERATVRATTSGPAGELTLIDLAPAVRDAPEIIDVEFPSVQRGDDAVEVYGTAMQFLYQPLTQESLEVAADNTLRVHMTSSDVVHGFAVDDLAVDRALVPGELETIELDFPDEQAEYTVRPNRYVGAGTDAMEATLRVTNPDQTDFGGWFDDVSNYDGVVDRRGEDEVTVMVAAEGNGGNFAFGPAAVRIDPGTTVVWEWTGEGGSHSVTAEDGAFESELTDEAGHTFEHTFEEAAVYRYLCRPHEALGMKGAVVVGEG
jgi:halocyanin-like protein